MFLPAPPVPAVRHQGYAGAHAQSGRERGAWSLQHDPLVKSGAEDNEAQDVEAD